MVDIDQIEQWLGEEVRDRAGERVGKLNEVLYSLVTGEAVFGSIKSGLLGRHADLVPLVNASVGRDHLRLAVYAKQIQAARAEVDVKDPLDRESAQALGVAYGVEVTEEDYESSSTISERRRTSEQARNDAAQLEE